MVLSDSGWVIVAGCFGHKNISSFSINDMDFPDQLSDF
jgi:hypothetical protein